MGAHTWHLDAPLLCACSVQAWPGKGRGVETCRLERKPDLPRGGLVSKEAKGGAQGRSRGSDLHLEVQAAAGCPQGFKQEVSCVLSRDPSGGGGRCLRGLAVWFPHSRVALVPPRRPLQGPWGAVSLDL